MSKRGNILNALKTAIESLDVFETVTKKTTNISAMNEANCPLCQIVPGDMPVVNLVANQHTTGSSRQSADGWQVALLIYNPPNTILGENDFDTFDNTYIEPIIENVVNTRLSLSYVVNVHLEAVNLYLMQENAAYIGEILLGIKYDFATDDY